MSKFNASLIPQDKILISDRFAQPDSKDVGRLARTGAKWAFIMLVLRQGVTMLTTMVVSRYVSPVDTGTVAMVSTFISFIVLFDTGLTWATVQAKDLVKEQLDNLFWVGVVLGSSLWLVCIISGPLLAWFYNNSNLILISSIIGLAPFFNSLTTQPSALLKRQLKQKVNNSIETAAIIISSLLSVVLALYAYGYWAIVTQLVSVQVLRFVFLMIFSGYRPGKFAFDDRIKPLLKLGSCLAASNYVCYLQLYLSSILMGRVFGAASLGNYSKAVGLKSLPTMYATMVVTDVMVASLAALQMNKEKMGEAYRKALALTAFIGCPISALLLPMAPEAVRLLYGSQWDMAVPMLQWLALPAIMLPISTSTIWLFLAAGKGRDQLRMNILLSISIVVAYLFALLFVKTPVQFVGVEAFLFTVPFPAANILYSHRAVDLKVLDTVKILLPVLICSMFAAGTALFMDLFLHSNTIHWFYSLCFKGVVGIFVYFILSIKFVRPLPVDFLEKNVSKLLIGSKMFTGDIDKI